MERKKLGSGAVAAGSLALLLLEAGCGGGNKADTNPIRSTPPLENTPKATQTIPASPTAIATQTQIVEITPTIQASPEASAIPESPEPPTHEGVKADLEQIRQDFPEAEKILQRAIEDWDRGKTHEEAGNLDPASNDYHGVFDKLLSLYNGFYAQYYPNVTCQPQLLTTAQKIELFYKAHLPTDWYDTTKQAGWWDLNGPNYGPGCQQ